VFFRQSPLPDIYLCRESVDFRKAINGLVLIVEDFLKQDALSGSLFVFINRSRDKIKVVYWDRNGFCLWHKRLEKEKFFWPRHLSNNETILLNQRQFQWLLDGFNLKYWKPHPELKFEKIS